MRDVIVVACVGVTGFFAFTLWTQNAHVTVYRFQCMNNAKNVALALLNEATVNNGQLAGSFTTDRAGTPMHSWVVDITPYIDRRDISDRWDHTRPFDDDHESAGGYSNRELTTALRLDILACPDAGTVQASALNYVVNSGYTNYQHMTAGHAWDNVYIDWNGDGIRCDPTDAAISRATGVMWPTRGEERNSMNLATITDGASQTILLTENVAGARSWADPDARRHSFVYPIDANAGGPDFFARAPMHPHVEGRIRGSLKSALPTPTPFPSSVHNGGVNVGFCDGSVRFVADDIDPSIYARLITPHGTRNEGLGQLSSQAELSENDY